MLFQSQNFLEWQIFEFRGIKWQNTVDVIEIDDDVDDDDDGNGNVLEHTHLIFCATVLLFFIVFTITIFVTFIHLY